MSEDLIRDIVLIVAVTLIVVSCNIKEIYVEKEQKGSSGTATSTEQAVERGANVSK